MWVWYKIDGPRAGRLFPESNYLSTIVPVVIEILTRMSYIVSVGQDLGLGFSGIYRQISWLYTDVKISVIDNVPLLVKGVPVNALGY
jgi:hypothetical protein